MDYLRSERTAVIEWLNSILHERFSPCLRLTQEEPGFARVSLTGATSDIFIASDFDVFNQASSDLPCTTWNANAEGWKSTLGSPIPAPGALTLPSPLIEQTDDRCIIHYDILGLTYWMLSRKEEVNRTDLDEHQRFPATSSHAYKHDYLERPVVDEWLDLLAQVIQQRWPNLQLTSHEFSMRVSHDVDSPSWYTFSHFGQLLRTMTGDVLHRHDLGRALHGPLIWCQSRKALHAADPANTFDWIMDISEQHGMSSAFYFICGRTDPVRDARYDPEHTAIRKLMHQIHSRGHEIGLHPSYNTFQAPEAIAAEAQRLSRICTEEGIQQKAWGGRMHFLRWETPTTLYGWELANMHYDTSLSYADRPGFRCGTCFEYPAFDPVRYRSLQLRIRPLIAMEVTVMGARYLGLGTGKAAQEKFLQLKKTCRAVNGCFTLLWHNSELETQERKNLYTSLLA